MPRPNQADELRRAAAWNRLWQVLLAPPATPTQVQDILISAPEPSEKVEDMAA